MIDYVSLHNQTHYSILDSIISPKDLFIKAKELGQKAIAITDHGTIASAWDALKASKETGVKLIIGCEFYFIDNKDSDEDFRHVILLAKNQKGYQNLLTLNKLGFDEYKSTGKKVYSVINWDLLKKHNEGLICLTACGNGIISKLLLENKFDKAKETLIDLIEIFKENLAIEVQPNNMKRSYDNVDQVFLNRQLISFGKKYNVKVIAANNAHYINKEDHEVHDTFLGIGFHSSYRLRYPIPDFYIKSGDEVKNFFVRNYGEEVADELCKNTIYFADMCENPDWIDPKYSNPSGKELPIFPVKDEPEYNDFILWSKNQNMNLEEDKMYLRYLCDKNFSRIKCDPDQIQVYKDRLIEEFDVIEYHGFSSYMLIVADYINWARNNNIAVGEGRGSVGGSLIAYLLNIHQADPIKYGLIFARFHNKEKTSFPDIDTDFAPSGRERVQNYLRKKYGDDHVAHVSNVNTITPKVYVKDIARIFSFQDGDRDYVEIGQSIADAIPNDVHSIEEAHERVPLFAEYCKRYPQILKFKSICGKIRAWSTHAGGIIISARPLTGLVPLRRDKDGSLALEYDKDKAEENGLVKMDTLGLTTLDIIGKTNDIIKSVNKDVPKINYDEYDEKAYDLITSGNTFTVFQLGTSAGTVDLCKKIKPKSINDISYINALARPSARDMRQDFIDTKDGKKKFTLLHPNLGRAFNNTFGFGLYEESLMYLAQDIAGWTLHSADRLRKLTKEKGKNPKKVQQWRTEFIDDAEKNNVSKDIATKIWDDVIQGFSGYGFNASHSILYSMTSYKTAYMKAHYPVEFLLANLMNEVNSNSPDAEVNKTKIKKEIRNLNVKILPPDINKSDISYKLIDEKTLITGLDALKFVGVDAINEIINKRPFKNFFDFIHRCDSSKVRSNVIQALVSVGAIDCFNIKRKSIFLYISDYRKKMQSWLKKHDPNKEEFVYPWIVENEWSLSEIYALEQFYLGESFICKPPIAYGDFFKDQHTTFRQIKNMKDKDKVISCKGIIKDFYEFKVKKEGSKNFGKEMIKLVVEDRNGDQFGCTIFPDRWDEIKSRLFFNGSRVVIENGLAINFSGSINMYEDDIGVVIDKVYSFYLKPALPQDLKAKKINLKTLKQNLDNKIDVNQPVLEQFENDLYDCGLIEIEDEEMI